MVSSAFGVGADWEQEFVEDMKRGWLPYFEQLRVYLSHFPGQRATTYMVERTTPGAAEDVCAAIRERLGGHAPGDRIALDGTSGIVERTDPFLLVRLDAPVPGMLRVAAAGRPGTEAVEFGGYLFPPAGTDVTAVVDAQRATWTSLLDAVTTAEVYQ